MTCVTFAGPERAGAGPDRSGNRGGAGHPHTFIRSGQDVRTTAVTVAGRGPAQQAWMVSGLRDLVVLKSAGSEFAGLLTDR